MPPTVTKTVSTPATVKKVSTPTSRSSESSPGNGDKVVSLFDSAIPIQQVKTGGYKFLIFGDSGTGKTTLACTFPKPLFFIRPEEVEEGHKSVIDVDGVFIPPYPLKDPNQLDDIIEGQRRTKKYASILLDGATCLQDLVVRKLMGWKDTKVKLLWGDVPQQDWGKINITFQGVMRNILRLADIGTHVIIVASERTISPREEAEVGIPKIMAALTPASTDWLHRNCDYNIHTYFHQGRIKTIVKVGGKETAVTKPSGRREYAVHLEEPTGLYGTKFRTPRSTVKPPFILNPDFDVLDQLIKGEWTPPSEEGEKEAAE
jgi:hypothetical protein